MVKNIEHERMRWACRRGMLELDLFLVPFFEACYSELSSKEKETFAFMLSATDPELMSWLMAHSIPHKQEVAELVEKVRQYRLQSKNSFV